MLHLLALVAATAMPSPSPADAPDSASSPVATAAATPPLSIKPGATPSPLEPLVLPAVPAFGPGLNPASAGTPSGDIAGVNQPFVGISLDDAISMALLRNTDLAVSQSNRRIAYFEVVAAKGAYDVNFSVQPSYTVDVQPPLSTFQTGPNNGPLTEITAGAQGAFSGNTTTGGNYRVFTSAQRIDNNFIYDSYDPYYETSLGFSFTQPLARNNGLDANRRQLEIAKINRTLSSDNALLTASNTLDSVLDAYYNLVGAWKSVAISEEALRSAKEQEASNARLAKRGAGAPVDISEADTQVAEFQNNVYSDIANVATLQNQLKTLLLGNPADPLWTANLVPTTPEAPPVTEPQVDTLVKSALVARPEVLQLRENIREENVNVAYEKNQKRPQIDLQLGVTENGFAGAPVNTENTPLFGVIGGEITDINALIARANAADPAMPLLPINASALNVGPIPDTIGKVGESYGTALRGQFPEYSISATISFPIRNRTAEGNYAAEVERRLQLQTQEVALIQRVQSEARNAVQMYRSARSRFVAANAARRDAEVVAASELRKFKAGASTTFLVLDRQVSLANARTSELQADTDLERALVELDRVSGSILSKYDVDTKTLGTAPEGAVPSLVPPAANKGP